MRLVRKVAVGAALLAAVTAVGGIQSAQGLLGTDGGGRSVAPTVPITPSVGNYAGTVRDGVRTFRLTAVQTTQQIATFPIKTAVVWGWKVTGAPDSTASAPGPTLVATEGERIRFVITNELSMPTSLHPHGTHQPNSADGAAGIDFDPIKPGTTRTYPAYEPGHAGTFAYHTHTSTAEQEPRGLAGLITVLPRRVSAKANPQVDVAMTLQQFNPSRDDGRTISEGAPAVSKPDERGMWPFNVINGKTGDASGGPIKVKRGDLVQIRLYNASSMSHSMHLHGMDMTVVAINGHPTTPTTVTTKAIAPGEFFTVQFRANNPGVWAFHCSFPDHQANAMKSGYQGAPVGMLRLFQVGDSASVPPQYFGPPA